MKNPKNTFIWVDLILQIDIYIGPDVVSGLGCDVVIINPVSLLCCFSWCLGLSTFSSPTALLCLPEGFCSLFLAVLYNVSDINGLQQANSSFFAPVALVYLSGNIRNQTFMLGLSGRAELMHGGVKSINTTWSSHELTSVQKLQTMLM